MESVAAATVVAVVVVAVAEAVLALITASLSACASQPKHSPRPVHIDATRRRCCSLASSSPSTSAVAVAVVTTGEELNRLGHCANPFNNNIDVSTLTIPSHVEVDIPKTRIDCNTSPNPPRQDRFPRPLCDVPISSSASSTSSS